MRVINFFQTQKQADEAKAVFIAEFNSDMHGVIYKHSSFSDRSNYIAGDDFILNLSWSGEQYCEEVTIYNKETFEDVEVRYFGAWE